MDCRIELEDWIVSALRASRDNSFVLTQDDGVIVQKKLLSFLDQLGGVSLRSIPGSIWRMRSHGAELLFILIEHRVIYPLPNPPPQARFDS